MWSQKVSRRSAVTAHSTTTTDEIAIRCKCKYFIRRTDLVSRSQHLIASSLRTHTHATGIPVILQRVRLDYSFDWYVNVGCHRRGRSTLQQNEDAIYYNLNYNNWHIVCVVTAARRSHIDISCRKQLSKCKCVILANTNLFFTWTLCVMATRCTHRNIFLWHTDLAMWNIPITIDDWCVVRTVCRLSISQFQFIMLTEMRSCLRWNCFSSGRSMSMLMPMQINWLHPELYHAISYANDRYINFVFHTSHAGDGDGPMKIRWKRLNMKRKRIRRCRFRLSITMLYC